MVIKRYSSLLAVLCYITLSHAQISTPHLTQISRNDSTDVFYQAGYRYVVPSFRNNDYRLEVFLNTIQRTWQNGQLACIEIYSSVSPEGELRANANLSQYRADEMATYILERISIPEHQIKKHATGVPWQKLRELVQDASDMPYSDEVLQVLDNQAEKGDDKSLTTTGKIRRALTSLHNGIPYRYMSQHLFPELRCSKVLLYTYAPLETETSTGKQTENDTEIAATATPLTTVPTLQNTASHSPAAEAYAPKESTRPPQRLIIKTNALGWGLLMMNAAVEWEFSERFSLHVPIFYSGANYFSRQTKFRMLGTRPELRIWPLQEKRFFAGIHFGVASYNLALSSQDTRIQDHRGHTPALGGGISVGYRMPFCSNKRFNIEFTVGAGAYRAHYDKFRNERNGAYLSTVRDTYIGPDNIAISFSYSFNLKKGKKR